MELVSEPYTSYFLPYKGNGTGGADSAPPCPFLRKNSLPGIGLMEIVSEPYTSYFLTYEANGTGGADSAPPLPVFKKK